MDKELKYKIFNAFDNGTTPVQAVIAFKIVPETIQKLYEEYMLTKKSASIVWGGTKRKLEKALGREVTSPEDFVAAMKELRDLVNEIYTEVGKSIGIEYTPPEKTLKEIEVILKDVDPAALKEMQEKLAMLLKGSQLLN